MKKMFFSMLLFVPCLAFAQIGLKAGLNFANVTNASSINNGSRTGYYGGIFFGSPFEKVLGVRIELGYSTQGYSYNNNNSQGDVKLNYITCVQMLTIGITRYFQIQLGTQMGYLLNAKADSTKQIAGLPSSYNSIISFYNRFDYGFGGGIEVHPVAGLLIGAKINFSLSNLYKNIGTGQTDSYSGVDFKNNVVQISAGWRFGKKKAAAKPKAE